MTGPLGTRLLLPQVDIQTSSHSACLSRPSALHQFSELFPLVWVGRCFEIGGDGGQEHHENGSFYNLISRVSSVVSWSTLLDT